MKSFEEEIKRGQERLAEADLTWSDEDCEVEEKSLAEQYKEIEEKIEFSVPHKDKNRPDDKYYIARIHRNGGLHIFGHSIHHTEDETLTLEQAREFRDWLNEVL